MALLAGEQILFNKNGLTITNFRVRNEKGKFCSILLKNVSSISITTKSNPVWLVAAATCFLFPLTVYGAISIPSVILFLLFGALFVAAYFYTTEKTILISSKGGDSIRYESDFSQSQVIADMIENIQLRDRVPNTDVPF